MPLKIYNSLTRKKEIFKPLQKGHVKMYVCGPTVYGPSHIGHARTYTGFDIIRRWLETKYKVKLVMNITDVHDDIKSSTDTKKFTKLFLSDMKALGVKPAHSYPKVSEHILEIKKLIKILIKKGFAYKVKNAIYFDVSKFKNYGKLSKRKLEKAKTGTRIDSDKFERNQAADFALWKGNRPGWHIECSAMILKHLGEQIDIHTGGNDLMFPHHENEIAQSEAATGKSPFVKYWMHSGMLNINGTKMSKSLKNYIEIPDLLKKYDPRVIRFFIASKHYRSQANFTDKAMAQAKAGLAKLDSFPNGKVNIAKEMDDDFNTPKAFAKIFKAKKWPNEMQTIFGIKPLKTKTSVKFQKLGKKIDSLRKEKKFKKADQIKNEIKLQGYEVRNTTQGTMIIKKS